MNYDEKKRLRKALFNSRRGLLSAPEEEAFMEACLKKHPVEYKALRKEVVEESITELNPLYKATHD